MQAYVHELPSFSLQGQVKLLNFKGEKILSRSFKGQINGALYRLGQCLYEVLSDSEGNTISVMPAQNACIELYLASVDISDAFRA